MTPTDAQRSGEHTDRGAGASAWAAAADLVVVGSGVAGLSAATEASRRGLRVVVVTKDAPDEGSTRWAQGGIAVVLGDVAGDSVAAHVADTLGAGGGLVDEDATREILGGGPDAVAALRSRGAVFDSLPGSDLLPGPDAPGPRLARTREGGHGTTRVIHAGGDATGAEVERALLAALPGEVAVLAGHTAVAVRRQYGPTTGPVSGLDVVDDAGRAGVVVAPAVVLATGGVGGLYETTTNPAVATADGWALALRAGAALADVEFVQFHPTALRVPGLRGRAPLVTEALRGEGARLLDLAGRPVMAGVDPRGDLAPRDVVAGAITGVLASTGADHVWLDATGVADVRRRFPTVTASCAAIGVDVARDPIPVRPAAHYACGGVVTDTRGRTGVPGLWAAGEVARTGLHGANRLASNSLLEGLVVGRRAGADVAAALAGPRPVIRPDAPTRLVAEAADRAVLQAAMSRGAAIGRDAAGLAAVSDSLESVTVERPLTDRAAVEDAALTLAAGALLAAAGSRTESRGCHVRRDHPHRDDRWQGTSTAVALVDGRPTPTPMDHVLGGAA
ncbi:L-aspartate oxidase [Actinomycetospora sp. TBRC 11914]|uniref:L-aspartate oxidase n=1 Tax=Actinomycetospora sp. TBRC 11914 TaxID=2729387 RepID=UPI00145F05DE|nr:L-aspartate oxidase [Actinomycetospora sp. TBRC 11914]NMO93272.1 L-aspartate oxidase [Actinomycetospora sp. TBRC 11914]